MIVLLILGILAAVVFPQFEATTGDTRSAALDGDLLVIRKAIELYFIQHNDTYPGTITGASSWKNFIVHMTEQTDKLGNPGKSYGPYLRTGIPKNPVNGLTNGLITDTPPANANICGWWYDPKSGSFNDGANTAPVAVMVPKAKTATALPFK